ncbi:hypothetical protein DAI22_03g101700 [Oryza sativa Japonica Group]|nr:hypothetical protein DAI22_03g101700 [Oryza sativa Japonica Group]
MTWDGETPRALQPQTRNAAVLLEFDEIWRSRPRAARPRPLANNRRDESAPASYVPARAGRRRRLPPAAPRAFLAAAASSPRRAAASPAPAPPPPPFTGRPLNPNPSHHATAAHGILYPVATSSAAAAAAAATANHRRAPAVAVGYPRAHAVAVPIVQPQHPLAPTHGRSFPAAPRAVVAGVSSRPEQPPRGVPIAQQAQPKVIPLPAVTPSPQEINNSKDSERSKEDSTTVVINDRKVNLMDSESGSLYALCRSWVRNGVPHESQVSMLTRYK